MQLIVTQKLTKEKKVFCQSKSISLYTVWTVNVVLACY
jgi:hypothetical protein